MQLFSNDYAELTIFPTRMQQHIHRFVSCTAHVFVLVLAKRNQQKS